MNEEELNKLEESNRDFNSRMVEHRAKKKELQRVCKHDYQENIHHCEYGKQVFRCQKCDLQRQIVSKRSV